MNDRKKPGWTFGIAGTLLVMPLLYVLSSGPVVWMFHRGFISESVGEFLTTTFYAPLDWLHENSEAFRDIYDPYRDLWIP